MKNYEKMTRDEKKQFLDNLSDITNDICDTVEFCGDCPLYKKGECLTLTIPRIIDKYLKEWKIGE